MAKSVPAIFLDRDGTINVDHGYVHEIDNFEFIDGVIDAMREQLLVKTINITI